VYLPKHFEEQRPEELRALMAAFPLATLVTGGLPGGSAFEANHIPLLYDPEPAPFGTLRGHMARANGHWRTWGPETPALAVFQGPQAYISPNWYPGKREHGRVVPTWNYTVVHAHGAVSVVDDAVWLRAFLDRLTAEHEADQPLPWKPADAPGDYIDGLLRAIVGVELKIARLEGKWKTSQNQPAANRTGVAEALEGSGHTDMARLVRTI
jgi:transcriptional regulator